MTQFWIHLKQKEKIAQFSLLNLKDEIHQMYDDAIYLPSRRDLAFFALLFFLEITHHGDKAFLEYYLTIHLPTLERFVRALKDKKRMLKKDEYAEIKRELQLEDFFKNDTFFVLLYGLRNTEYYLIRYSAFFKANSELKNRLEKINELFWVKIEQFYGQFEDVFIEDDRIDVDSGNQLDLSKSVTRTIEMRLSRKVENSVKKFTKIKEIKSQSPIDFNFVQDINLDLIYTIWDQFKVLAHYTYTLATDAEFLKSTISWTASGVVGGLIVNYVSQKNEGTSDKQKVVVISNSTVNSLSATNDGGLLEILRDNLERSNEIKEAEILKLKEWIEDLEKSSGWLKKTGKNRLKKLKIRLRNLLNLSIDIEWQE